MAYQIFFIISILTGQLIKIPLFNFAGPTLLDLYIFLLTLIGVFKVKFQFKKQPLFIIFGLSFTLFSVISLVVTPLHLQFNEYLISLSYTLRFFLYMLFALVIYSNVFPNFRNKISQTLFFSGVGLAILGLIQFLLLPDLQFLQSFGWDPHYFRTVSTFLDPNFAGAYFVLTLLLLPKNKLSKKKYIFYGVVYLALLTTFSRSSYLMFLVSGVMYAVLSKSRYLLLKTLVLFAVLLICFNLYNLQVAKPRHIDRTQSASYRLDTWQEGTVIFQKSPLIGIGFNAYRYALAEYRLGSQDFINSRGATYNDSSFLTVLSTTGILGFIIYLLFLYALFKRGLPGKTLPAALIGLIAQSFFANVLFYPFIFIWLLLKAVDTKD